MKWSKWNAVKIIEEVTDCKMQKLNCLRLRERWALKIGIAVSILFTKPIIIKNQAPYVNIF